MTGDRYVLLGLAPARAEWFRAVAHWCNAASVPAEFVKCVSPEQVRAQLSSGRPFSALVVDAAAGLDRDLLDLAGRASVPVLAVGEPGGLAVQASLPAQFGPDHLLDALASCAARVSAVAAVADDIGIGTNADTAALRLAGGRRGQVVAVCGPGGTGASTVAVALAQGLGGSVLLADLCLHAEQAMLHDAREVVPGVQELVEAFRARRDEGVRRFTFEVGERGYDLLLGLRQARSWPVLRPRAFEAAFAALQSAWDTVVCDTDPDVQGERECGSADVEDRNLMARTAVASADVVFVVGVPGMKGVHSVVRVVNELLAFGVPASRVVPVVNRAPRSPRARAEIDIALSGLVGLPLAGPVFVPERRVDELLRDGARLPPVIVSPLVSACRAVVSREAGAASSPPAWTTAATEPTLITPGSLGSWGEG